MLQCNNAIATFRLRHDSGASIFARGSPSSRNFNGLGTPSCSREKALWSPGGQILGVRKIAGQVERKAIHVPRVTLIDSREVGFVHAEDNTAREQEGYLLDESREYGARSPRGFLRVLGGL